MTKKSPAVSLLYGIDRVVFHIEEKSVAFCVIGLACILTANVLLRMFNSSLPSTEELSQFLMFFITFLGTSYAARSGMHIRMSMFSDALKGKYRKALAIVIAALTSAVMFYLAWLSLRYVIKVASLHRVSPILQIPVQYVWIIMPVGMFLTGIQYALALFKNIISPGAWISFSVPLENEFGGKSEGEDETRKEARDETRKDARDEARNDDRDDPQFNQLKTDKEA
ncbi:MAG: TRAP transporter small permease [Deltaproteobacteria bacterium]|jgi:TRAP-type C4-dicarboxylate transport system permease small subunit|nr:TRAP transporter small permease [Deltaproteobacteria bacterium]